MPAPDGEFRLVAPKGAAAPYGKSLAEDVLQEAKLKTALAAA
jgi:hypothetical protein